MEGKRLMGLIDDILQRLEVEQVRPGRELMKEKRE